MTNRPQSQSQVAQMTEVIATDVAKTSLWRTEVDFPADVGNRRLQSALRGAHRHTSKSIHSAPSWVVSQALWANEFKEPARLKFHTLRPGPLSRSV